jgi:hypothetical protein
MSKTTEFADLTRIEDHPAVRLLLERRTAAGTRMREIEVQAAQSPAERRSFASRAVVAFIDTGEVGAAAPVAEAESQRRSAEYSTLRDALDEIEERLRLTRYRATEELLKKYRVVARATESRAEVARAVDAAVAALQVACDARVKIGAAGLMVGDTTEPGGDVGLLKQLAAFRLRLGGCEEARRIELQLIMRR